MVQLFTIYTYSKFFVVCLCHKTFFFIIFHSKTIKTKPQYVLQMGKFFEIYLFGRSSQKMVQKSNLIGTVFALSYIKYVSVRKSHFICKRIVMIIFLKRVRSSSSINLIIIIAKTFSVKSYLKGEVGIVIMLHI